MTTRRLRILLIVAVLVITAVFIWTADAGERGDWFKSLKQPGTGTSCCDISDCKRAEAEWKDGQWWAMVAGQMTPIPPEKELLDKTSIDGEAYVCASPNGLIYCFVKPDFGT